MIALPPGRILHAADDAAGDIAAPHRAVAKGAAGQGAGADKTAAGRAAARVFHIRIHQAHIAHRAGEVGEQSHKSVVSGGVAAPLDEQVGNGAAVAFKNGGVGRVGAFAAAANGRPADAALVVRIAVVADAGSVGAAAAVGVKVQVGGQFVANAGAGAAHTPGQAGEGAGILDGVGRGQAAARAVAV